MVFVPFFSRAPGEPDCMHLGTKKSIPTEKKVLRSYSKKRKKEKKGPKAAPVGSGRGVREPGIPVRLAISA